MNFYRGNGSKEDVVGGEERGGGVCVFGDRGRERTVRFSLGVVKSCDVGVRNVKSCKRHLIGCN